VKSRANIVASGAKNSVHISRSVWYYQLSYLAFECGIASPGGFKVTEPRSKFARTGSLIALAVLGVDLLPGVGSTPARGLTINLSYDSSVTDLSYASQVQSASAYAAQQIENIITDPITVNGDNLSESLVAGPLNRFCRAAPKKYRRQPFRRFINSLNAVTGSSPQAVAQSTNSATSTLRSAVSEL
jgi:hypothetical protein